MKTNPSIRIVCLILAVFLLAPHALAADLNGAADAICNGYRNNASSIPLEQYGLQPDELEELFTRLKNDNRLPWYTDIYTYYTNPATNLVTKMEPKNLDESVYDRVKYEQAVSQVLAEAVFPGMNQWQIALSVHDYLVSHFRYDETYTYYAGYDLLVGETAVCEGYARAYMDILKRAGVEAIYAISEDMNHAWNLVKIGDEWYHVDATWDDPITDSYGRVRHHYFLLDDATFSDADHKHYNWETSQTADSNDLASGVFWLGVESAICYENASVSYLRKTEDTQTRIYRRDEQSAQLTELVCIDEGYIDVGHGRYHYGNYGLSLWNGTLYFSDMKNVYAMNTDGTGLSTIYTYDAEGNNLFISGSFVDDGTIYLTLNDHEYKIHESLEVPVPGAPAHEHSYVETRIEPTCYTDGSVIFSCSCGDSYESETLTATGHSYESTVTREPSATAEGEKTFLCSVCGHSYTEVIPATGSPEPPVTIPVFTDPPHRETRPSNRDDNGGFSGFPLILIILAIPVVVVVLLLILLLTRKKPKKQGASGKSRLPQGTAAPAGYGYGYGSDSPSCNSGYSSGSDGSYGGSGYGSDNSYGGSGYGSDDSYGGSCYGSDNSYGGSGYGSDESYGGSGYGSDDSYGGY